MQQATASLTIPVHLDLTNPQSFNIIDDCTSSNHVEPSRNCTMEALGSTEVSEGALPVWLVAILASLAGCMSLVTVSGNLIVLLSFFLERSIRQPTNYFIASLAMSDLLIGAVSMPFYTVYLLGGHHWALGAILCDLWLSVDYTVCLCSIYTVFCITIDRFCSVTFPAKYREWRTEQKVLIIVACTWIIPALVFFPSIFGWQVWVGQRTVPEGKCYVQYMEDALFNCLLQVGYFWVTLCVMCALYAAIYRVALNLQLRSQRKTTKMTSFVSIAGQKFAQIGVGLTDAGASYETDRTLAPGVDYTRTERAKSIKSPIKFRRRSVDREECSSPDYPSDADSDTENSERLIRYKKRAVSQENAKKNGTKLRKSIASQPTLQVMLKTSVKSTSKASSHLVSTSATPLHTTTQQPTSQNTSQNNLHRMPTKSTSQPASYFSLLQAAQPTSTRASLQLATSPLTSSRSKRGSLQQAVGLATSELNQPSAPLQAVDKDDVHLIDHGIQATSPNTFRPAAHEPDATSLNSQASPDTSHMTSQLNTLASPLLAGGSMTLYPSLSRRTFGSMTSPPRASSEEDLESSGCLRASSPSLPAITAGCGQDDESSDESLHHRSKQDAKQDGASPCWEHGDEQSLNSEVYEESSPLRTKENRKSSSGKRLEMFGTVDDQVRLLSNSSEAPDRPKSFPTAFPPTNSEVRTRTKSNPSDRERLPLVPSDKTTNNYSSVTYRSAGARNFLSFKSSAKQFILNNRPMSLYTKSKTRAACRPNTSSEASTTKPHQLSLPSKSDFGLTDRRIDENQPEQIELQESGKFRLMTLTNNEVKVKDSCDTNKAIPLSFYTALIYRRQPRKGEDGSLRGQRGVSASERIKSKSANRAKKALRTITIILGAFVVCWTPWHVLSMMIGFCPDKDTSLCVKEILYDISYWLCYLNSPLNPFCYALANQQFKKTFARILRFDWHRS